jgi:cell division protein FtsQ
MAAEGGSMSETRAASVHPRLWARRVAVLREQGRHRLRLLIGVGAVVAIAGAGWLSTRSPLLDVDRVRVLGARRTPLSAVLAAAAVDKGDAMIDVSEDRVARQVARLPWVEGAEVARRWPSSLVITVTERKAIAAVRATGGGWALVDRGGRVLEKVALPPDHLEAIEAVPPAGASPRPSLPPASVRSA